MTIFLFDFQDLFKIVGLNQPANRFASLVLLLLVQQLVLSGAVPRYSYCCVCISCPSFKTFLGVGFFCGSQMMLYCTDRRDGVTWRREEWTVLSLRCICSRVCPEETIAACLKLYWGWRRMWLVKLFFFIFNLLQASRMTIATEVWKSHQAMKIVTKGASCLEFGIFIGVPRRKQVPSLPSLCSSFHV